MGEAADGITEPALAEQSSHSHENHNDITKAKPGVHQFRLLGNHGRESTHVLRMLPNGMALAAAAGLATSRGGFQPPSAGRRCESPGTFSIMAHSGKSRLRGVAELLSDWS